MSASLKMPALMSVTEFLAWDAPGPELWQLVDGQPQAMAPANTTHGSIQSEIGKILAVHLETTGRPCFVVITPGIVPRALSATNCRIPDLAVTCAAPGPLQAVLAEPVLVVEILSPSNKAETWSNVWTYTSIPSVQDILVVRSDLIGAYLLRRAADGSWQDSPLEVAEGFLDLPSVGLRVDIAAFYRTTHLAPAGRLGSRN